MMHDPRVLGPGSPSADGGGVAIAFRTTAAILGCGFCRCRVVFDERSRCVGVRVVETNDEYDRLEQTLGRVSSPTSLLAAAQLDGLCGEVASTGQPRHLTQTLPPLSLRLDVRAAPAVVGDDTDVVLLLTEMVPDSIRPDERAGDARFRTFADIAPVMLWVTESDGACTFLSREWYAFTGQTPTTGLGYGWLDAVHPDDRADARQTFLTANATRAGFMLQHRLRRFDGVYRWVSDAGRPREDEHGTFQGYVGAVVDIHDRTVAEERLAFAMSSGGVGLWHCDLPFDVLVWDRQVKEHFGLPHDAEVTIDTFYERMHPDDRDRTREAIESAIATHAIYHTHFRTLGLDGQQRWVRAVGRAGYEDGRPIRFDGITVDVTELVMLRERSDAANRAKDDFLAMLGHELRNPLAPIVTAVELLKLRGIKDVERERTIIDRQVRHLTSLVDDLLDVSRITSGRLRLHEEVLDFADVVTLAAELAAPLFEQQQHVLHIDVHDGLLVRGDVRRLTQVVSNLLTNAAKYMEPRGSVAVIARAEPDDVVLTVTDTGEGIDPVMLPTLFEPFVQDHQALARSRGGLGLGLAIVRSVIDLHGGRVTATSGGRGMGAQFTVRLPRVLTPVVAPARDADVEPQVPVISLRVLVVDDNQDAALLLGVLARTLGCDVRVVHDGPSALVELERFAADIALIDIGMPVMDGYAVARHLRDTPQTSRMTLVALTGYGQASDREASLAAGFDEHLVKPVEALQLQTLLASTPPLSR